MANTTFNTDQFSHDPTEKEFYQEASTLQFHQVPYITIKSARTGVEALFEYNHRKCDREGDIEAWVYVPWPQTLDKYPGLKDYKVVVLND